MHFWIPCNIRHILCIAHHLLVYLTVLEISTVRGGSMQCQRYIKCINIQGVPITITKLIAANRKNSIFIYPMIC